MHRLIQTMTLEEREKYVNSTTDGHIARIRRGLVDRENARESTRESDPNGTDPHTAGAKLDAGKHRPNLVLGGFARALTAVSRVGTYGAEKYTNYGWKSVPDGINRYSDAMQRHWLAEAGGELRDPDTTFLHAAHTAWNALARLDLMLKGTKA